MTDTTMPLTHILAASHDEAFVEKLAYSLSDKARVDRVRPESDSLSWAINEMHPDFIVIDIDEAGYGGRFDQGLIRKVSEGNPDLPLVCASFDFSGQTVATAFRNGARDVLDKARVDIDSVNLFERATSTRVVGRARSGRVCAVVAPYEGVDARVLARGLASQLMTDARGDTEILLVDTSNRRFHFDGASHGRSPYSIEDAIGDIPRLDETLIDSAFEKLPGTGVRLLERSKASGASMAIPEYDLMPFVSSARRFFSVVLLMVHADGNQSFFRRVLRDADSVIAVTDQRLVSVAAWASVLNEWRAEKLSTRSWRLAVTRCDRRIEPPPGRIIEKLGIEPAFQFPDCRVALTNAENAGVPLVEAMRGTRFLKELGLLSATLTEEGVQPARASWICRTRRMIGL